MKPAIVILLLVGLLIIWTAVRYRKQIVSLIIFWKQFQDFRKRLTKAGSAPKSVDTDTGIKLVNCARCGKWIPESSARRHSATAVVCTEDCRHQTAAA